MSMQQKVVDIVTRAGELLLEMVESGFSVSHKGAIDLVTDADRASELYITEELKKCIPDSSIYAEEQGWSGCCTAQYIWLIDPLDGTTNYAHGFPHYAISVALVENGKPRIGVVYSPASKEMFTAELGQGTFLNGKPVRVSQIRALQNSLLATGFPYDVAVTNENNLDNFAKATKASQGVRRTGAAALDLCYVACGRLDGYWERTTKAWDVAAGSLIVQEAGGKITNLQGQEFAVLTGEVVASNGLIHDHLVKLICS